MFHPQIARPHGKTADSSNENRSQAPLRSPPQSRTSLAGSESDGGTESVPDQFHHPARQPVPGARGDFSAVPLSPEAQRGQHPGAPTLTGPAVPAEMAAEPALEQVDDSLEDEADRFADRVMSASDAAASVAGDEDEAHLVQFVARRFGHDLSEVRIHADAGADGAARALHARAYTVGTDVVFARGEYAPATRGGQRLLAHELAHVIQQRQGLARSIQRKPDDSPQPDAGSPGSDAPAQAAAAPDPDANEAEARKQDPSLPQISKQSAVKNEAAVGKIVVQSFGGEEGLNDAFDNLSQFVKKEVGKGLEERKQFFIRLRLYFDNWKDLLDHFSENNLVKVDREYEGKNKSKHKGGKVQVVLAKDAAEHLNRGLDVLEKMEHPFPSITVGFGLRGYYKGDIQSQGYMIHALGYAFDVAAARNPKIGYSDKPGTGPEQLDPYHVATVIPPASAHMDMGDMNMNNSDIVARMGKRTAAGSDKDLSAEEDKDPEARKYFERFKVQFNQMMLGSRAFIASIPEDRRQKLLNIREAYLGKMKALKELNDEHAKAKKPGRPGAPNPRIAQLEEEQRQLLAQIVPLVTEWVTFLDSEIEKTLKDHPEMRNMRSPAEISRDLKTAEAGLERAKADEARTRSGEAKEQEELERELKTRGDDAHEQDEWDVLNAPKGATRDESVHERVVAATRNRDKYADELKKASDKKLAKAWPWLTSYKELSRTLKGIGLNTADGRKNFERLMIGKLEDKTPVENPPLLRLLDTGIFNPDNAFDLKFFEEMAHSGFVPGATWSFGGADPMHFELQEGRKRIVSPSGTDAPGQP
jgi:hypothetical protein